MNCSRMGMNMQKIIRAGSIHKVGRQPWKNNMHEIANKAMAALWGSSVGEEKKRGGMHMASSRSSQAARRSLGEDTAKSSVLFMKRRSPK